MKNISLGRNFTVLWNSALFARDGHIIIGDNVWLGINNEINALGAEIRIGSDCMFGSNVVLIGRNHSVQRRDIPIRLQGYVQTKKDILVEDDVWIGANSVVLPGVAIGKGAVVGAGSIVTKSVAPYCLVGGVPARFIRER